jgi:hypothetical protein
MFRWLRRRRKRQRNRVTASSVTDYMLRSSSRSRTPASHVGNTGSNPVRSTYFKNLGLRLLEEESALTGSIPAGSTCK